MINILCLDQNKNLKTDISKDDIASLLQEKKSLLWIDLDKSTDEELRILSDIFHFHHLAVEDCAHYTDLPKIDEFEDHLFIVIHGVLYDTKKDEVHKPELDIFVGKHYVVTVHNEPLKTVNLNLEKVRTDPAIFSKGADFLLYNLIDVLVDNYISLLDYWDDKIERLEDKILSGEIKDIMPEIIDIKRKILGLRRSIGPQRDIISKLSRRDSAVISNKNVIYFRDIYDHMVRVYEILEVNRELLTGTFETYLSTVSNRMNEIMKRLTIVATIFMPLTLIVGIYGMNFNPAVSRWNMPELNWPYGYISVMGLMAVIALGMILYFRRKKWL